MNLSPAAAGSAVGSAQAVDIVVTIDRTSRNWATLAMDAPSATTGWDSVSRSQGSSVILEAKSECPSSNNNRITSTSPPNPYP